MNLTLEQQAAASMAELSTEIRKCLGVFDTEAALNAAAATSPLAALKKCLGLRSLSVPPQVAAVDERIVARRKAVWGITAIDARGTR